MSLLLSPSLSMSLAELYPCTENRSSSSKRLTWKEKERKRGKKRNASRMSVVILTPFASSLLHPDGAVKNIPCKQGRIRATLHNCTRSPFK